MDQELKQYLESMEARISGRVEAVESRVGATESRLEGRMETMEARLMSHVDARIEKVETNLLSAFHGWARGMEIRVRGVSGMATGFDERLALAEERISELERRKAS